MMYMAERDGEAVHARVTGVGMAALAVVDRRHLLSRRPADAGARSRGRVDLHDLLGSVGSRLGRLRKASQPTSPTTPIDLADLPGARVTIDSSVSETDDIDRELHAARGGTEAARGGVQHVLRRPAAASAVGDAQARRRPGQAARSDAHHQLRRSIPVHHAAVALRDVRRPVGSRAARARGRTRRSVRAAAAGREEKPKAPTGARIASLHVDDLRRSAEGDGQGARSCTTAGSRRVSRRGRKRIPFHKFADLVKTQVDSLKEKGSAEVAFRVAVKDGKVAFTARGAQREIEK